MKLLERCDTSPPNDPRSLTRPRLNCSMMWHRAGKDRRHMVTVPSPMSAAPTLNKSRILLFGGTDPRWILFGCHA